MFGITTRDMPEVFLTDYAAWDFFMASIWSVLIKCMSPNELRTVIEIAPGSSTKIGQALQRQDFCGTLYVIEPDAQACDLICKRYHALLPQVTLVFLNHTLRDSLTLLPKQADLVLSNHPLDDMMLAAALPDELKIKLFSWVVAPINQPSRWLVKHWHRLYEQPDKIALLQKKVFDEWALLQQTCKPRCMIVSQYPSATLQEHTLQTLNQQAVFVLNELKKALTNQKSEILYQQAQHALNQIENYNNKHIGESILAICHWLLFAEE